MAHYADTSTYSQEEIDVWNRLQQLQGNTFHTARGLEFKFEIIGNEMFIDRKEKSITRSTVNMAYRKAAEVMEREGKVKGPKKLGVFGSSYLYSVFLELGICTAK